MTRHAKLMSPSAADRWGHCHGSPAMEEGLPDMPGLVTDEGSAAHFLAAHCLTTDDHPATYLSKKLLVGRRLSAEYDTVEFAPDDPSDVDLDFEVRREIEIDAVFAGKVNAYVQYARQEGEGREAYTEYEFDISDLTGEEGGVGTTDRLILDDLEETLTVLDLKFGYRLVRARESKQLRIYAIAALREFDPAGTRFRKVRLIISQPRVFQNPDVFEIDVADLREFEKEIRASAALVVEAYDKRELVSYLPGAPREEFGRYLHASEDACEYCKARDRCPKLAETSIKAIVPDLDPTKAVAPQLKAAASRPIAPDWLNDIANAIGVIKVFVKAMEGRVYQELLGGARFQDWKLVSGRMGDREWSDSEAAAKAMKAMRMKDSEIYVSKIISPAAAEGIFGKNGSAPAPKRWETLQAFITRSPGKPTVAPVDDKREAIVIDPLAAFDDLTVSADDNSDLG